MRGSVLSTRIKCFVPKRLSPLEAEDKSDHVICLSVGKYKIGHLVVV
jgi:hypothetical protein